MLLVFDVGNTETTMGLFNGEDLVAHWRTVTNAARTPDEIAVSLIGLLQLRGTTATQISAVALGSVVPAMTEPLSESCRQLFGVSPVVVDGSSPLPIVLDVEEPRTVGADRIINTLAASQLYKADCIVVDLGTATTYDCITADGVFLGGVIAPGVRTSADTLFRRTSKLPATELTPPTRVIGRRTEECIRSGVIYGAAAAVDGIVRRIKGEWPTGRVPRVIATGGLAPQVAELSDEIGDVDLTLTLVGLRIAHGMLTGGAPA